MNPPLISLWADLKVSREQPRCSECYKNTNREPRMLIVNSPFWVALKCPFLFDLPPLLVQVLKQSKS